MTVTVTGIDKVMKRIDQYKNSIPGKQKILMEKLAEIGIDVANMRFAQALYNGVKDVTVSNPEWISDTKLAIYATGSTVAFIEFGTGVHYSEVHPKAGEFGAERGGFGQGKGRQDSWGYYGDQGSPEIGKVVSKPNGKVVVITQGNPPARAMYEAGKEMRDKIREIAKEVYGHD